MTDTQASRPKDLYADAGVDTQQGDELVDWLQAGRGKSANALGEVVSGIGGFAALFKPDFRSMKEPILVSSTDGVGTKLLLGVEHESLGGIGQDLVAMCVNDIYTIGARPLFFLDYFATGKLDQQQFKQVVGGIQKSLAKISTPLIGGETAELPGLYQHKHFDLAGFVIGAVDRQAIIGPQRVQAGDILFGLPSSGFHSNGYSLIRKWVGTKTPSAITLSKLLEPTIVYDNVIRLIDAIGVRTVHAAAHITGGGISGNLPRVIPEQLACHIERSAIPTPEWMQEFLQQHDASFDQVEPVFNLGVGMIIAVDRNTAGEFESAAKAIHQPIARLGEVKQRQSQRNEGHAVADGAVIYH